MFLLLYWTMTGFHAIHVTIGIGVRAGDGRAHAAWTLLGGYYSPLDVTGLYWHFVDVVWIFLLPMLYLLAAPIILVVSVRHATNVGGGINTSPDNLN